MDYILDRIKANMTGLHPLMVRVEVRVSARVGVRVRFSVRVRVRVS